MSFKAQRLSLTCLLLALAAATASCGKEAKVESKQPVAERESVESEMEAELAKQSVVCDNGVSCPGSIAKVVIVDKNKLKFCTGVLVNGVTLATSSSCLTDGLRISGDANRCAKDVHIFFPRYGISAPQRVKCRGLVFSSPLPGKDATLWRNDIAYIDLDVSPEDMRGRRYARLSREGIEDRKFLTLWKVDADNGDVGVIRRDECQALSKSYVNPLSDTSFSPVVSMVGCAFKDGNTGGMLMGAGQRWRGLLSKPLAADMQNFLVRESGRMIEPLAPIVHVSNGACLPSVIDSDVPTERDCFKDLNETQLNRRRADILNTTAPFEATRLQIVDDINKMRPYFKWDVELVKDESQNSYRVVASPRCLNPIEPWIGRVGRRESKFVYSMTLPDWSLSLGFDRGSRLVSRTDDSVGQKIYVQFSPKQVVASGSTYIYVWRLNENTRVFNDIAVCEETIPTV